MKLARVLLLILFACSLAAEENQNADFQKVADEYIKGWLAAHPLQATSLGFHEYDGRINDYTRLSIDAELSRLKRFDERLKKFDPAKLNATSVLDLRILQCAIKKDLFDIQDLQSFDLNPMTYARALDVNVYTKRDFAPLTDRLKSIIALENQLPNIMIAAKTNLAPVLPKPYVELAIEIARGGAEFLKKDLVDALKDIKDPKLNAAFAIANRKAFMALSEYASWLEKDRLPNAGAPWAIGEEKYRKMLAEQELVDLPPAKVLEIGLAELKREQQVFAEAGKIIDPTKSAQEVFKDIQKEHPAPESLIPDVSKNLEIIRQVPC